MRNTNDRPCETLNVKIIKILAALAELGILAVKKKRITINHSMTATPTSTEKGIPELRCHVLDTGYTVALESFLMRGGALGKVRCHSIVALLEHPAHGWTLFDTGYAPRIFAATRRLPFYIYRLVTPLHVRAELAVAAQLSRFGLQRSDIKRVIISHFHADHVAGLRDFPQAGIIALRSAYDDVRRRRGVNALRRAFVPSLLPRDFARRATLLPAFDGPPLPGLGPTYDLFGRRFASAGGAAGPRAWADWRAGQHGWGAGVIRRRRLLDAQASSSAPPARPYHQRYRRRSPSRARHHRGPLYVHASLPRRSSGAQPLPRGIRPRGGVAAMNRTAGLLLTLLHFAKARWRWRFLRGKRLRRFQERRARRIVEYANARSPFYRQHWAGHDRRRWRALPTVDKRVMMENFDHFNTVGIGREQAMDVALRAEASRDFSPTLRGFTVGLSSGTSGHRGIFLASPWEQAAWAGNILSRTIHDLRPRRLRVAFFLRSNSNLYEKVGGLLVQFQFFDLMMPLSEAVETLNAFKPHIVVGPPSLLGFLAGAQVRGDLHICPERLVSVAEVLDPQDREHLEVTFHAPVHQIYQCTEGLLAVSCKLGSLHIQEDLVAIQLQPLQDQVGAQDETW